MALSDADFQSLQQQLVDAKSALYQSREDGLKLKQELLDQRARSADLERDAARAADLLARSRRARELEQLMADNEKLRVKVQNAEDDFKLQYATLMTEYSSVLSENERLQSQLETYKAASRRVAPADGAADSVDVADAGDTADSAADAAEPALQRSEDYLDQKVAILQAAKKELLNQIGEFQLATDELRRANQQAEAAAETERASNGAALAKMAEATERRLERQRREADLALGELERRLRAEAAEAERDLQDRLAEAEARLVAEEERRQQQLAKAAAEAKARAAEAAERASAEAEELRAAQQSLSAELETARSDAEAARSEVSELRQQLQDSQQDVRLAERKVEL
uniref:Protein phosphatase 1 regulatory subunit 21 n=1 Tax=Macrostomum lignano TaxID=282301 RepID=A0A1I8GLQ9_9PLAT